MVVLDAAAMVVRVAVPRTQRGFWARSDSKHESLYRFKLKVRFTCTRYCGALDYTYQIKLVQHHIVIVRIRENTPVLELWLEESVYSLDASV